MHYIYLLNLDKSAIFTLSLGQGSKHCITRKINAAGQTGFKGVEIFIEDLVH